VAEEFSDLIYELSRAEHTGYKQIK